MLRLFRYALLTSLLLATVLNAGAQKYEREWNKVDSLIGNYDQVNSIEAVRQIMDKAQADGNCREILRCALMINRLDAPNSPYSNYTSQSYQLFDSLASVMDDNGLKAICHYLQAFCLDEYARTNNFRIPAGNILDLDIDQLKEKMFFHFEQAFKLAGRKRTKDYAVFIPDCNDIYIKVRPALKDVLLESACINLGTNDLGNRFVTDLFKNDDRLLGTSKQFVQAARPAVTGRINEWKLYVLRMLTERNLKANADVRASIDLKRLTTIYECLSTQDWISVSEKVEKLADSYRGKSLYSAGIYALAAKILIEHVIKETSIDKQLRSRLSVHAHDLLETAIGIWPDSQTAHDCRELLNQMEKRSVSISFDRIERADMPNLAVLRFSNVDTVWFKAVRYDRDKHLIRSYMLYDNKSLKEFQDASDLQEAARWSVTTGNRNDWIEHAMWMSLPALKKGEYIIYASVDRNFANDSCFSCRLLTSSRLLFSPTYLADTDTLCSLTGFIHDAATGDAISGCSYTITGYDDKKTADIIIKGQTATDGFLSLDYPISSDCDFMLCIDYDGQTDTLVFESRDANRYSRHQYSKGPVHIRINTDRAIYRPGDTVRYCGIVSETPADMNGRVKAGIPVAVFVSGRNDVLIQETITDAHGLFEGIWPVPADYRPGWIELNAISYPNGENPDSLMQLYDDYLRLPGYSHEIKIESYSRNLLELKFDRMPTPPVKGAQAECTGKVFTPLGNPVSGARIQWETSIWDRNEQSFTATYRDLILETGETETLPDGTFRIPFKADDKNTGQIDIKLRVTDRNGETHEFSSYYTLSSRTELEIAAEKIINSPNDALLTVRSYNYYPDSGEYRIIVEALKPHHGEGMDIYTAFSIKDHERTEMSEHALSQGSLSTLFPRYEFGLPSEPQVSCTVLDSLLVFHNNDTAQILVPGIKTGHYRITVTSDNALIRNLAGKSYYGEKDNAGGRTQDIFVSVGDAEDTLSTNELLYLQSRQIILREGDTAKVRIGSPYPGTIIRYDIINRNGSLMHGSMESDGLLHTLSLPVGEDLCGSILVVATAFKDGLKAKSFTAQYIPYYTKQLKYELTTFRSNLTSGSQESWSFRFIDRHGNPVKASVLVDMYDSVLDKLKPNYWTFFPWKYTEFTKQNPIRIDEVYRNVSIGKRATLYEGIKTMDIGIANPLSSPLERKGLPIPLREASSTVSTINDIPSLIDNNGRIASSDQPMNISQTSIRKDLSHTGLYLTHPKTDENGVVTVSFKAPELLTRWNLQVFAYTDDLLTTGFGGYVTTSRPLMIEPAATRFFRQGDVTDFAQKITNTHTDDLEVTVLLRFKDAENGHPLDLTTGDSVRTVTVKAGSSVTVPFRITIPDGVNSLTYTAIAAAQGFSDGQQETIPVLSNRVQVTKSMSLFNNGNETRTFKSDAPATSASRKVFDETLTLQYHSQPIWYALEALPALTENNTPDNLSLAYNFAAQAMTYLIVELYPAAKGRLKKEQYDENLMKQNVENYYELIQNRQNQDGGWPWMPGGKSSVYVTSLILYVFDFMEATMDYSYYRGLEFLASQIQESVSRPSHSDIMFLYLCSARLKETKSYISNDVKEKYDRLLAVAEKYNYNNEDLYYRGLILQLFMSAGKTDIAHNLAKRLLADSEYSDEMGRFWQENRGGYLWHEAPIETQSILIHALKAAGYEREANEAARWLLKQKETTAWESTPATAAAVMALLETANGSMPDDQSTITVTVGNDRIESGTDGNKDGYMSRTWNGPVSPDKGAITVSSSNKGISWGALYHTFTQNLNDVENSGNGMQLKRTLWRIASDAQGERLEEVTPGTILHMGDRIKVRLELTLDRTYEYLQLKSERAASMEPVSTNAGYTYNLTHDILYYRAPTNTSDDLYIERLESGSYTIEYDLYVQKTGTYSMGLATIQCLYAPAYRAITPNTNLTVE